MVDGNAGVDIEQQRRRVRALLALHPRGFAADLGLEVTNNPAALFQLLVLGVLTAERVPSETAAAVLAGLRGARFERASRLADARVETVTDILKETGLGGRAPRLATRLHELAEAVRERYNGDLRRLRSAGDRDSQQVRQLLGDLPGVRPAAVGVFARDAQAVWPELGFTIDRAALRAAQELGLPRRAADLFELVGGDETERPAWVAGALALVQERGEHDEVRRRAESRARRR